MRVVFNTNNTAVSSSDIRDHFTPIADQFAMHWLLGDREDKPRVLIMVSKTSHCLNDLLHRWSANTLSVDIVGVISNHRDLEEMASWYKIPFHYLPINQSNKEEQEAALLEITKTLKIDLVVLARYMQILSPHFCRQMPGRIINIHHSFLPSFKGAKPYHQAYDRGVKLIGATAHYVTDDLDEGPIIDQETIRVSHSLAPADLVQLGCDAECTLLARAIKYHIEQRVLINGHKTIVFS